MGKCIEINGRLVGEGQESYIIAEMSANHAGSMERAKQIIHAAKEAGADCIKIQTYTPDSITIDCSNKYFQITEGTWKGENLYGLYGKAFTPWEWQAELKEEARKIGIDFLSTPFDQTSVDFLESIDLEFYKIASFELVDIPLIEYIASKHKPIIMSTGMATFEEIKEAVEAIEGQENSQYALLKCSSAYPADPKDMHLRTICDLKEKFGVPVGLSDHSMGYLSAVTATTLGASIIEKHICLGREIENPDSSFSMTPSEFAEMVKAVRDCEKAIGNVKYGVSEQEKTNVHFRRSLFIVEDVKAGEVLTNKNVRSIRPNDGLAPKYYKEVLGKKAKYDMSKGTPLSFDALI